MLKFSEEKPVGQRIRTPGLRSNLSELNPHLANASPQPDSLTSSFQILKALYLTSKNFYQEKEETLTPARAHACKKQETQPALPQDGLTGSAWGDWAVLDGLVLCVYIYINYTYIYIYM